MKLANRVIIILYVLTLSLFSESKAESKGPIVLDKNFYSRFIKIAPIMRDTFLDGELNRTLQGKGQIESVDIQKRYNRHLRIIIIDSEALHLNIRLYLYTSNEEYLKTMKKGDLLKYKGQFVIYTPLDSRRDSYIFDILLEDGSFLVE